MWSAFCDVLPPVRVSPQGWALQLRKEIWIEFLKRPLDEIPFYPDDFAEEMRPLVLDEDWYHAYDLVQFLLDSPTLMRSVAGHPFRETVARILEEEMAGFRLVDGEFVEITDENEIRAIEGVLEATATPRFAPSRSHLQSAMAKLSDRRSPDYRNSIKESISAVESVVGELAGSPNAPLGKALNLLEQQAPIHGALKDAFSKLYGWTSDDGGIRHALIDGTQPVDAADAKFMLVACSGFVSYLIQKLA